MEVNLPAKNNQIMNTKNILIQIDVPATDVKISTIPDPPNSRFDERSRCLKATNCSSLWQNLLKPCGPKHKLGMQTNETLPAIVPGVKQNHNISQIHKSYMPVTLSKTSKTSLLRALDDDADTLRSRYLKIGKVSNGPRVEGSNISDTTSSE